MFSLHPLINFSQQLKSNSSQTWSFNPAHALEQGLIRAGGGRCEALKSKTHFHSELFCTVPSLRLFRSEVCTARLTLLALTFSKRLLCFLWHFGRSPFAPTGPWLPVWLRIFEQGTSLCSLHFLFVFFGKRPSFLVVWNSKNEISPEIQTSDYEMLIFN